MQFTLISQSGAPLYHQIFMIIRSKIFDGEYGPGVLLPTERELERTFKVSRITAVRALNELALAGLVVRERGRGTRVQFVGQGTVARGPLGRLDFPGWQPAANTPQAPAEPPSSAAKVRIYEFDYIAAGPTVAKALQLLPAKTVQYSTRVWRHDGTPFNHITTYVPEDIGRQWGREDLEQKPLADLFEQCGVKFGLVHEHVTATMADLAMAERLEVNVCAPLLKIMRTTTDIDGRPVEYLIGLYAPERYQYEVTLPSQAQSSGPTRRPTRSG